VRETVNDNICGIIIVGRLSVDRFYSLKNIVFRLRSRPAKHEHRSDKRKAAVDRSTSAAVTVRLANIETQTAVHNALHLRTIAWVRLVAVSSSVVRVAALHSGSRETALYGIREPAAGAPGTRRFRHFCRPPYKHITGMTAFPARRVARVENK